MLFFFVFDLKFLCNYQYVINIRNYLILNVYELDKYVVLYDDKDCGDDNVDYGGMVDDINIDEDCDYYYDSGCCNDNDGQWCSQIFFNVFKISRMCRGWNFLNF